MTTDTPSDVESQAREADQNIPDFSDIDVGSQPQPQGRQITPEELLEMFQTSQERCVVLEEMNRALTNELATLRVALGRMKQRLDEATGV